MQNLLGGGRWGLGVGGTIVVNSRWQIRMKGEKGGWLITKAHIRLSSQMHILLAFLSYSDTGCH